ncbi:MAG: PASTA domain-containing protein [Bacilli bacterium]
MEKSRKEFIESLNNDNLETTSSFKDIMSRSELRQRIREKEQENKDQKDLFQNTIPQKKEMTNTFDKINSKSEQKKIAKQQEQAIKLNKIQTEKEKKQKEKKSKAQKRIEKKEEKTKNKQLKKQTNKSENGFFLTIILIIILLCSISYLIYNFLCLKSDPNMIYIIANCSSIAILTILFMIALKIKRKPFKTIFQTFSILIFLIYITITCLVMLNIIKIPNLITIENFQNQTVTTAMKWADENHINLNINYDFSDNIEKNLIISQNKQSGMLTNNMDSLSVVVSNGPNYDQKTTVPNMVGWNITEIIKKINQLKLNNVVITYEFNNNIKKDTLFEQNQEGSMTRNNKIDMKFSLGNIEDLKPLKLNNLKNMKEFDATLWLERNGITYEIEYKYNKKTPLKHVISTDPKHETIIDQTKDKVKLTISKGPKIIAPNLMKMSLDEIMNWANKYGLSITYGSEFDEKIKSGKVKRVAIKKGELVNQENPIHIIMSKGKLKMIDYNDNDLDKIRTFALKNNIPLNIIEEYNNKIIKGKLIDVSHKAFQLIKSNDTITLKVSLGISSKIPNFMGMTVHEAKNKCQNAKLSCSFNYVYSNESKDTVIYQNKASGQEVMEGSSITLSISKGPAPAGQNNYIPPSGGSDAGNNTGGNSGSNPPPTPPPTCDRNITTKIYLNPTIGNASATAVNLQNQDSLIKWVIQYVNRADYSESASIGQFTANSTNKYDGISLNYCDTYTIQIFNK